MTVSYTIKGIPQAIKFLKQKAEKTEREIENSMKKVGRHMQNEVKESIAGHKSEPTSVDTGHLMRNVFEQASKKEVVIFTHVPYANVVENSTRITGGPRRHFQNSFNRNKQKVISILKEGIKNI